MDEGLSRLEPEKRNPLSEGTSLLLQHRGTFEEKAGQELLTS